MSLLSRENSPSENFSVGAKKKKEKEKKQLLLTDTAIKRQCKCYGH